MASADYFCKTVEETFHALKSQQEGLSVRDASARLAEHGKNALPVIASSPWWKRFAGQFHNVLIYVLLASALVSAAMQHYLDAGIIIAVVLVNAIVGFIQEGKAESALRAILSMSRTQTMVMRDGVLVAADSELLVPGDVVLLQAGDRVPADMRLFYCKDLRCDESALTGEAQPVGKRVDSLPEETVLAERKNMAFMGTMVTAGMARGLVCATGVNTQIGEVSDMVGQVEMPTTPLQKQLKQFAVQLSIGIIVVSALTIVLGILVYSYPISDMFQAAIGIAVSAIPEGLPAVVTIALAIGVQRMAKNRALVRRLPAVEVLGSVDVICSDKTGTLTANAMTVREVFVVDTQIKVLGEGYCPAGGLESDSGEWKRGEAFDWLIRISSLCNEASLVQEDSDWVVHGDPTEGALLCLAMKLRAEKDPEKKLWPRVDVLPFESDRRYMATLHDGEGGDLSLLVKGAPEKLFQYAAQQLGEQGLESFERERWEGVVADFARRGMRVLALAFRPMTQQDLPLAHEHVESNLVLVGLVGISDPPRVEAISSIQSCHQAGVTVKMITGDSPVTAQAIGRELGLSADTVLTGREIDTMSQPELVERLNQTDIVARASPANKLQIVSALQGDRHVVAMTGDGVNDAPALKKADIGVAMGKKGTDAAKEAADFVLTDDNFSTITRAVSEGRAVYDNIVKSIIFILPTNLAEALVIITAILAGRLMPITPAQILWVNMITAVTLALALAFERPELNIMRRPPRPFRQGLISLKLLVRMVVVGSAAAFIVFALFFFYRENGASIELARTVTINALVMVEVFYLFNCRFLTEPVFSRHFFAGSKPVFIAAFSVIVLQLAFTYLPLSQSVFGLAPIGGKDWLMLVLCSVIIVPIVELEKWLQKRF